MSQPNPYNPLSNSGINFYEGQNGIQPVNPINDPYQTPGVLPVIDVVLISTGAKITINLSDYNPAIHSAPGKVRQAPSDDPNWPSEYHPELGTSIPIQVVLISSGATEVIWSSTFNSGLHSAPTYMVDVQTSLGSTRLSQLTGLPYRPPAPGPFGIESDLLGTTVAVSSVSRALAPWPSTWPLPSLFKSPYETGGGTPVLT